MVMSDILAMACQEVEANTSPLGYSAHYQGLIVENLSVPAVSADLKVDVSLPSQRMLDENLVSMVPPNPDSRGLELFLAMVRRAWKPPLETIAVTLEPEPCFLG